ncbi:MAG: PEGA domain-containing protein [Waddliaceae bacterium]
MKFSLQNILIGITLISLTSCATVVSGTRQPIGISSYPSNANVWIDSQYVGNTPLIQHLTRKHTHWIRIELEGFQPYETVLTRKFNKWVLGNILIGGVIGVAIDIGTGAVYALTPEQIQAELASNNITYSKNCDTSFIEVVLQPDPSWKQIGTLTATH